MTKKSLHNNKTKEQAEIEKLIAETKLAKRKNTFLDPAIWAGIIAFSATAWLFVANVYLPISKKDNIQLLLQNSKKERSIDSALKEIQKREIQIKYESDSLDSIKNALAIRNQQYQILEDSMNFVNQRLYNVKFDRKEYLKQSEKLRQLTIRMYFNKLLADDNFRVVFYNNNESDTIRIRLHDDFFAKIEKFTKIKFEILSPPPNFERDFLKIKIVLHKIPTSSFISKKIMPSDWRGDYDKYCIIENNFYANGANIYISYEGVLIHKFDVICDDSMEGYQIW